jgi:hypothetical protein
LTPCQIQLVIAATESMAVTVSSYLVSCCSMCTSSWLVGGSWAATHCQHTRGPPTFTHARTQRDHQCRHRHRCQWGRERGAGWKRGSPSSSSSSAPLQRRGRSPASLGAPRRRPRAAAGAPPPPPRTRCRAGPIRAPAPGARAPHAGGPLSAAITAAITRHRLGHVCACSPAAPAVATPAGRSTPSRPTPPRCSCAAPRPAAATHAESPAGPA